MQRKRHNDQPLRESGLVAGVGSTPTVAVTGSSIRINTGIVPSEYVSILADGLKSLNQAIIELHNPARIKFALPVNCFYGSDAHKAYLTVDGKQKYATEALSDIFQILWQQVEKKGKTTLQNMMRTSFCRDGISAIVYQSLEENNENLFMSMANGLAWAASQMRIVDETLSFNNAREIHYPLTAQAEVVTTQINDATFWGFITRLFGDTFNHYRANPVMSILINDIHGKAYNRTVTGLYKRLEVLNELIFLSVLEKQAVLPARSFEDGYGSDSEDEESFESETVYTKKLIVSNGMRAILATLLVIGYKLTDFSLYADAAYYEVAYGAKLLKAFAGQSITLRKPVAMTTASVYLFDVNACVTDGVNARSNFDSFVTRTEQKTLVLDTTSATTDQMHEYVEQFSKTRAKAMMFVSSGLKNEQLGADKNSYGTIRFFTKDKPLLKSYYDTTKNKEPAVDSPISHEYRRTLKQLGAVPTARAILKK